MAILDWLLGRARTATEQGDTDTVIRIVKELDRLEPGRARYLAAFAYVLSRVAGADRDISADETTAMVGLLERVGHLPLPQATLVVEIAKSQNRHFAGTEDYLVTREFRALASDDERRELLDCLFAVSKADATISSEEDAQMRQIAAELGFSHDEYIAVRLTHTQGTGPRL